MMNLKKKKRSLKRISPKAKENNPRFKEIQVKVVIAMSGGVDSSVAAALLQQEGYEVIGLTMQLTPDENASESARKVADKIGISHKIINLREIFDREIVSSFCREYSLGRTPNPCVLCNKLIKFGALWEKATEMGADFLATGHYAQVDRDGTDLYLKKGSDIKKDQSYFLCMLTREQLSHVLFPVGRLTKAKVRQIARETGIPSASRPESQEICFIPDDDYAGFLKKRIGHSAPPGPILDESGNVLGEHRGITTYTIGQRHGLGIGAAEPLYVIAIESERNAVIVGTKAQTYGADLIAGNLNWIVPVNLDSPLTAKAKVRYRQPETEAIITALDNGIVHVKFTSPQMSITPGQTIAFYEGDKVLGGGTIIKQGRQL
jgi:tRNA-specific 2-thiouridylase